MKNVTIKAHGMKRESCYVLTWQGPRRVWQTYKEGGYERPFLGLRELFELHGLRWGAYGDPAALPFETLDYWSDGVRITGYTHQWARTDLAIGLRNILMASVDSIEEAKEAQDFQWRTFRVDHRKDVEFGLVLDNEIVCPASDEAGNRTDCQSCALCRGHAEPVPLRKLRGKPLHKAKDLPLGVILYEGPSMLDRSVDIVCIATGIRQPSSNAKTGPMVQTWIMRQDTAPHDAQRTGEDEAVCGDCKLRPFLIKQAEAKQ